jgi:chromosome segregation ATPase
MNKLIKKIVLQHELKKFEKALIESSRNHDTGFSDFLGAIDAKDVEAQRKIAEFELIMRSFSEQNEQLCQKIEKMELEKGEVTRKFNQLSYENSELKEKLEEIKKLQDECYEGKRRLADAILKFDDIEKKFQEKSEAHEKSLQVIQKACEHIEDLELHVEQLKSSQPNSLSSTESAKNDDNFSHANGLIVKLRHQVEQITVEKNDEINRLKEELQKKSRMTFTPLCNSSALPSATQSILQSINFPTNESSFNEIIEKNRNAQKKIHFLKQKLR